MCTSNPKLFEERVLGSATITLGRTGHQCAYRGVVFKSENMMQKLSPALLSLLLVRIFFPELSICLPVWIVQGPEWDHGSDNLPHVLWRNLGQV